MPRPKTKKKDQRTEGFMVRFTPKQAKRLRKADVKPSTWIHELALAAMGATVTEKEKAQRRILFNLGEIIEKAGLAVTHVMTNRPGALAALKSRLIEMEDTCNRSLLDLEILDPIEQENLQIDDGRCHSSMDGDCSWGKCPQLRDGEPKKSGRDCPLEWPE